MHSYIRCLLGVSCLLMLSGLTCWAATTPGDYLLDDFDTASMMNFYGGNGDIGGSGRVVLSSVHAHSGKQALCWTYDFNKEGVPTPGCVYARCGLDGQLPGRPTAFSLWMYADASAAEFRLTYRYVDATGRVFQRGLGTINWTGWQRITGAFDANAFHWGGQDTPGGGVRYPISRVEFVVEGGTPTSPKIGSVYLDDFRVQGTVTPTDAVITNLRCAWQDGIGTGSNPGIIVLLGNYAAVARPITVQWSLTDVSGKVTTRTRSIQANANGITQFALPIQLSRGYAVLTVDVTDPANPDKKISRTFHLARLPQVDPAIDPSSPFGINGHSTGQHMKPFGVGFTRTDWPWELAEKADGVWNFDWYDHLLEEIHANGLEMLPILGYNPKWLKLAPGQGTDHAKFLEYVRRTAQRYKGRVRYYDLWNEPDLTWPGSKQEFGDVMYEAYKIIKSIDPQAVVIYPSCCNADLAPFIIPSLASFNGNFPFDVLAVHPYTRPKSPDDGHMREKLLALRSWMDAHGGAGKPVWISECGWATANDLSSVSEPLQAAYLARLFIIGRSAGVQKIVYYMPFSWDNMDDPEAQFGILRSDATPKPSAAAYAQVAYRLKHATFLRDIDLGAALRCVVFQTPTQTVATVYATGQPVDLHVKLPVAVTLEAVDGAPLPRPVDKLHIGAPPVYLICTKAQGASLIRALTAARLSGLMPVKVATTLQGDRYLVQLKNTVNRAVTAQVAIRMPQGWQLRDGQTAHTVTIPQAETVLVSFPVSLPAQASRSTVDVTITTEGEHFRLAEPVRTIAIPHASGTEVLSGLRAKSPTVTLSASTDVMPPAMQLHWKGANDLSATTWWAWDDRGLYLTADVRDDVQCNTRHGAHLYEGDSIQIAVNTDTGMVPGEYDACTSEFGCALTDAGVETYNWVTDKCFMPNDGTVSVTRDEANKLTRYDVFVTWQALGMPTPRSGATIGINMIVNEDDGAGRKSWLQYAPGIAESKTPSLFLRGILTDATGE